MNAIGYDAMVLGNHEFDYPLQILYKGDSIGTKMSQLFVLDLIYTLLVSRTRKMR